MIKNAIIIIIGQSFKTTFSGTLRVFRSDMIHIPFQVCSGHCVPFSFICTLSWPLMPAHRFVDFEFLECSFRTNICFFNSLHIIWFESFLDILSHLFAVIKSSKCKQKIDISLHVASGRKTSERWNKFKNLTLVTFFFCHAFKLCQCRCYPFITLKKERHLNICVLTIIHLWKHLRKGNVFKRY